jgi:hypothetical protein
MPKGSEFLSFFTILPDPAAPSAAHNDPLRRRGRGAGSRAQPFPSLAPPLHRHKLHNPLDKKPSRDASHLNSTLRGRYLRNVMTFLRNGTQLLGKRYPILASVTPRALPRPSPHIPLARPARALHSPPTPPRAAGCATDGGAAGRGRLGSERCLRAEPVIMILVIRVSAEPGATGDALCGRHQRASGPAPLPGRAHHGERDHRESQTVLCGAHARR